MRKTLQNKLISYGFSKAKVAANSNAEVRCNWNIMSEQLLRQWAKISRLELEQTGHNRQRIAMLIQRKYGITVESANNYLRNFERTLPLLGCA